MSARADAGGVLVSVGQRLGIWIACLLAVVVVGAIDAVTGFELSMSIFYLVPVTWAACRLGRGAGVALAVAAADTDESGTASAFERLRADLWRVGRTDVTAVRFGGGLLVSEGPVRVGALLKRADDLMYGAKRAAKGLVLRQRCDDTA